MAAVVWEKGTRMLVKEECTQSCETVAVGSDNDGGQVIDVPMAWVMTGVGVGGGLVADVVVPDPLGGAWNLVVTVAFAVGLALMLSLPVAVAGDRHRRRSSH